MQGKARQSDAIRLAGGVFYSLPRCHTRPNFGTIEQGRALYCVTHRKKGMVRISREILAQWKQEPIPKEASAKVTASNKGSASTKVTASARETGSTKEVGSTKVATSIKAAASTKGAVYAKDASSKGTTSSMEAASTNSAEQPASKPNQPAEKSDNVKDKERICKEQAASKKEEASGEEQASRCEMEIAIGEANTSGPTRAKDGDEGYRGVMSPPAESSVMQKGTPRRCLPRYAC